MRQAQMNYGAGWSSYEDFKGHRISGSLFFLMQRRKDAKERKEKNMKETTLSFCCVLIKVFPLRNFASLRLCV